VLIDALQQVYQTLSTDVSLKIWGETRWNRRNVDRLRRRIGSLPARICGPFDHDDAKEVYAGIDVLVLPSVWWENSSLAILEAQAMGIPVIATAIGGNSELVLDGHNGLLAQPGSASDLARQMRKIATDSSLRRQLQRASRQQKDMALYAQEMTAIYNRL
jgi:glycosyltransferase involved in cell wall biosynthesis